MGNQKRAMGHVIRYSVQQRQQQTMSGVLSRLVHVCDTIEIKRGDSEFDPQMPAEAADTDEGGRREAERSRS
ncbi:hypothetical protein CCHR01_03755 [Colletotrichum chrysophilum]|uniref:Uncharacterized protein n=1 Tax=Colletotrichum chrysophilum TaxID=1836956 RepID=A0AAD9AXL6_9PEZI|nr:hypothetical protein CCHR01_03755 [Colletotrichum chrysophilum]